MSSNNVSDFLSQPLIRSKKYSVGFETLTQNSEVHFVQEEHIHLSLNIEDNLHYFGTASEGSISTQVGLFHPYHPEDNCLPRTMGFPEVPVSFECPIEIVTLPEPIQALLSEYKASSIFVRPFFQNMPWASGRLLFRPQHVIFSPPTLEGKTQLKNGTFSAAACVRVAIFSPNITIDNTPLNKLSSPLHCTSHPSGTGYTLCSPCNGVINGVVYTTTSSCYTVTVTTTNGNITSESKWYISLVHLLNRKDFQSVLKITSNPEVKTIADIISALDDENLNITELKKLLGFPTK